MALCLYSNDFFGAFSICAVKPTVRTAIFRVYKERSRWRKEICLCSTFLYTCRLGPGKRGDSVYEKVSDDTPVSCSDLKG